MPAKPPRENDVRLCEARDLAAITRLNNHAIEHTWAHFGTEPVGEAFIAEQWERDRAAYPWLVAEFANSGEFAGFAKAGAWKSRGAYRWTVEIGVYIEETARGLGIGRTLYEKLFGILSAQGFVVAFGGVALPNPASERLHESVGMTPSAELEPSGYKLGKWRSVRYYVKVLNEYKDGAEPKEPRPVQEVIASVLSEPRA